MDVVNAISKARFSSARPQRVQLSSDGHLTSQLVCMEPGQTLNVEKGQWSYYVVTGEVTISAGDESTPLPTAQLATTEPGETHKLTTPGERRAVVLAVGLDEIG
jgi:mannose-6-phosphate isomerase-like protein (cupin superfamily)